MYGVCVLFNFNSLISRFSYLNSNLHQILTCPVKITPVFSFSNHRFQVFLPDIGVLPRVFDNGTGKPGCNITSFEVAVAKVRRQRLAVIDYRNGFSSTKGTTR